MRLEYDLKKSEKNRIERSLPFDRVVDFDWESAIYDQDIRRLYPEKRIVATGYLGERLHILCFSPIKNGIRVISFRKANQREVKKYEKKTIDQ